MTRADMVAAGWSPSVRLFEAAACAVPVISDGWDGLETFFAPGRASRASRTAACVEAMLRSCGPRIVEHPGHEIWICYRP